MVKKALALIFTGMLSVLVIGCSSSKTVNEESTETVTKLTINEGRFSKNYTKEEVENLNLEISEEAKELITFYGLEYLENTETKEGVIDKYIYFDNLESEANRVESVYYSYKTYGEKELSASFGLKIGFKLDLDQIKDEKKFDFEETSMMNFSNVLIKDEQRDYIDLNNKIIEIVNSEAKTGSIETEVDGLVETIMIKDDYLLYKLDSKTYNFE